MQSRRGTFRIILSVFLSVTLFFPGAVPVINAATETGPAAEWTRKASKAIDEGKYDEAVSDATEAIRIDPDNAVAYNLRGKALYWKNESKKAIEDFNMAIKLKPDYVDAYIGRGNAKDDLGLYDSAIADQNMALKLEPNNARAYESRGMAYYMNKSYALAVANYSRALQIDPNSFEAYRDRGNAYFRNGAYDLAIQDLDKALRMHPNDANLFWQRARAYVKKGDFDSAISDCNRSQELNPSLASPHFYRGLAYEGKGRREEALAELKKAVELKPKNEEFNQELEKLEGKTVAEKLAVKTPAPVSVPPGQVPSETPAEAVTTAVPESLMQAPSETPAGTVPATAVSGARRVLTPFKGYALADPCEQSTEMHPGMPWDPKAPPASGPVSSKELGQYQALLDHTMQGLLVLYGDMSEEEVKSFYALWAPFADFPTQAALEYFRKITPLLDEMIVVVNDLNGGISTLNAGLEDVLVAGGDPDSMAVTVGNIELQRVKAGRARLDDLAKRIEALGNPPNPLAAKCGARKRHKKALVAKQADSSDIVATAVRRARSVVIKYTSEKMSDIQSAISQGFEDTQWSWQGNTFRFVGSSRAYNNPCDGCRHYFVVTSASTTAGGIFELSGVLSNDGTKIEKIKFTTRSRTCACETRTVSTPSVDWEVEANAKFAPVQYGLQETSTHIWYDGVATNGFNIDLEFVVVPQDMTHTEWTSLRELISKKSGVAVPVAREEEVPAPPKEEFLKETPADTADPAKDPEVIAESIAQFEARAEQFREDAARWEADAAKAQKKEVRDELLARASERYAQAQAEQDTADTLRTGTIVKTRTPWDEKQTQDITNKIKAELAGFKAEDKLMDNIPVLGERVTGAEGVAMREQLQKEISEAIKSPDRLHKLVMIQSKLQNKIAEQEIAGIQADIRMIERKIGIAEDIQSAASTGIMLMTLWNPVQMGTTAILYATGTGGAEGGLTGATKALVRSSSMVADIAISGYEGATQIDPYTGKPGGFWGAIENGLMSLATNMAFQKVSSDLQAFKAEMIAARQAAGLGGMPSKTVTPQQKTAAQEALAKQAAGGKGVKEAAIATGEGRIKEFGFKTPQEIFEAELHAAKTPEAKAAVEKEYPVYAERQKLETEIESARQQSREAIRRGEDPAKVDEEFSKAVEAAKEKHPDTRRTNEHFERMDKLGFNSKEPTPEEKAKGIDRRDIVNTGSMPKNITGDLDFAANGGTWHEKYQRVKKYANALKDAKHNVVEYGDRWVDYTDDITIWKPDLGTEMPGSSSFEAEMVFGSLPHSDKFAPPGAIEWTSNSKGRTGDPLGAVIANAGKAAGAGLGNDYPKDFHTIGKSAAKAADIGKIKVEPELFAQIKALKEHKLPEQAGVYRASDSQAVKDKKSKVFLDKVLVLMGQAYTGAKARSELRVKEFELNIKTKKITDPQEILKMRMKFAGYKAGDNAALATVAWASPGLGKVMPPLIEPVTFKTPPRTMPWGPPPAPEPVDVGGTPIVNFGGLARTLFSSRESAAKAAPVVANSKGPVFAGLDKRCKEAVKRVDEKIKAAKPGSDEAKYLNELKNALKEGEKNPAEAVRSVRNLSGTELAAVLAQLGVPADSAKKP